jgi:hypothetical protein
MATTIVQVMRTKTKNTVKGDNSGIVGEGDGESEG